MAFQVLGAAGALRERRSAARISGGPTRKKSTYPSSSRLTDSSELSRSGAALGSFNWQQRNSAAPSIHQKRSLALRKCLFAFSASVSSGVVKRWGK